MTTVKDEVEAKVVHACTINVGAQRGRTTRSPSLAWSLGGGTRERGRNWGRLLSALIIVNIIVLGTALLSGSIFSEAQVTTTHLQIFLIVLIIPTTGWMVYYTAYMSREDHAVLYKDGHAGPVWLRGWLVLFGLLSLIMDVFKIAYYVGYLHCNSTVKIAFPVAQAVFILVQTYFLWFHAKDCVQLQRNVTRCGLMLTLSTNLMLWVTMVTEESLHQTVFPNINNTAIRPSQSLAVRAGGGTSVCECSHSACDTLELATYYLYPFNIEYSLFASAMAYIMWKNVGRLVDEYDHSHPLSSFRPRDVLLGPVAGLLMLVAGLVTFVKYEVDIVKCDEALRDAALTMHYVMNTVAVALMSAVTVAGCAIYRLDQRSHVSGKNPTRSLDVGLLVGASVGQVAISYYTIVAVVATGARGHLNALNLACSLLTVVQLCLQNLFIIEGLHREPFGTDAHAVSVFSNALTQDGEEVPGPAVPETRSSPVRRVTAHGAHPHAAPLHRGLSWKRRVLKEICAFLLLCNIILWIMPAFGARPQFDNIIGMVVFDPQVWVAVVNIGLPFGIFYRMHSVASLFEVFLST